MSSIQWIKNLVLAEQQMEETGMVDFSAGFDPEDNLEDETIQFLADLKAIFIESASAFNELKGASLGTIKIYGISKTKADFMLFRNGYKLIISMKRPGSIAIYFNQIGSHFIPGTQPEGSQQTEPNPDVIQAHWGAYGDLEWTFRDQPIKLDYMVRYYLTRFIKESAQ